MQLFALSDTNELVSAATAVRQQNYICPECRSRVRVRSGVHRTAHFFHLDEERSCRQNGKSLQHLQTQFRLQQLIPNIQLELPFPSIARIADAAWEKEKIVFEIQCSPISAKEIKARNRDYTSIGWTPVWIFHEERYNKRKVTAAEWAVWRQAHYFTNIDEQGIGDFYTHLSEFFQGTRRGTICRKAVVLNTPVLTRKKLHFSGDGWDIVFAKKQELTSLLKLLLIPLERLLVNIQAIMNHFFEKACR